jgi:fructokinase
VSGTALLFGETLVDDFSTGQVVGGAPFNVARHLAAFMAPQLMITRVGADANGEAVQAEFERFAMDRAGLQRDPIEETGRVLVERGPGGHRRTLLPNQAYDYIDAGQALAALDRVQAGVLYFGTLGQRAPASRAALEALFQATRVPRFFDLNLRPGQADPLLVKRALQAANIVKLNEDELQALLGWYLPERADPALAPDQLQDACRQLLAMFSLDALILTLGHRGSAWFGADGASIVNRDNPAPPFVIDTVGAGDAFAAIFLLGQLRGWALATTLARSNEFAGAICAVAGAVPRDLGFYDQWVGRWRAA